MDGVFNLHTIFFRMAFALHSSCLRCPYCQPCAADENLFAVVSALADVIGTSYLNLL